MKTRILREGSILGGVAALLVVGGCNSSPVGSAPPTADPVSQRLGNLLAFNSTTAPSGGASGPTGPRIDCPIVQVEPGASSFRSASGDSAAGVRYQIAISDVARDCALQGDKIAVRVGVETNVVLGPAGSPGTYTAPLRVTIRKPLSEAVVASKTYRVGGAVSTSGPAQYSFVADPLLIPYTGDDVAQEYEVVLAFGGEAPAAGRRTRAR